MKDWPGGLGEESSHVEGFAVADSRGEGSSGAGGSVPDGIPSLEPDGAPVVPGSGLNLFGDYVGDWLQEPHDTVEDSHSPYVPVTLEMPEAEIVDDAEEDVRVFEGREAQAFQRAVFEQGMSLSGGGLPKLPRETGIYAGTFGDVNGFLDAGACRTFGGV